jgi:hypothetical protein
MEFGERKVLDEILKANQSLSKNKPQILGVKEEDLAKLSGSEQALKYSPLPGIK